MKKKFVYFLMIFLAIVLQTSVLPVVLKSYATGDIVLMLVLAGAVLDGFAGFLGWAIFAGILYDLASFQQVGMHALIFLLVVYFVSFFSRRFSVEIKGSGVFLFSLFVVVATIISQTIVALSMAWDLQSLGRLFEFFGGPKIIIFQIIFNIFLFLFCFHMLRKMKAFFDID